MKSNSDEQVYWERQGVDQLCGVHCVNSLLQGPLFNEIDLANIALELDKKQKKLMAEEGMTKDFMNYLKQDSGNVAMDGNYSIQVLQEALKTLNLPMVSIETIKNQDLTTKQGFICNSAAHWFSIRKVNNIWYNLNSLGMRLPQIISDFYLSAFLISVRQSGFQIFSVQGEYPKPSESDFEYLNKNQEWYSAKRIKKYHEKKIKRKNYKPNISGGNDNQMEKAIALSLGKKYEEYKSSGEDENWDDPQEKNKVIPFHGQGVSMGGDTNVNYDKFFIDSEDVEMLSILKFSIEEKFKVEQKNGIEVMFRFSSGKKETKIFSQEDFVENLYDWIWLNKNPNEKFYLVNFLSKQKVIDLNIPISLLADPQDHTVMLSVIDL